MALALASSLSSLSSLLWFRRQRAYPLATGLSFRNIVFCGWLNLHSVGSICLTSCAWMNRRMNEVMDIHVHTWVLLSNDGSMEQYTHTPMSSKDRNSEFSICRFWLAFEEVWSKSSSSYSLSIFPESSQLRPCYQWFPGVQDHRRNASKR